MSKALTMNRLQAGRGVVAGALCVALSAFGCTTDRTLGNGQPTRSTPYVRTAPTAGVSSGSQTSVLPPSMTSSALAPTNAALPETASRQRNVRRGTLTGLTADQAAAIMAQRQGIQSGFRVLGPSDPGFPSRPYVTSSQPMTSAAAGRGADSTLYTVNETPFSVQVPGVVDTGATTTGITGAVVTGGGVTDVTGASGAATVISGSLPPLTAMTSSSVARTTNASVAGPSGVAVSPSASIRGTVPGSAGARTRTTGTSTVSGSTTSVGIASPVRMVTQSSGRVVITNVTASGRSE